MKYFAVFADNEIKGFIVEESQKDFLIESYDHVDFYEFDWNKEEYPMITDFKVIDGKLVF